MIWIAGVVLISVTLLPLAWPFVQLSIGSGSLETLTFPAARAGRLLLFSVGIATASTALSLLIGVPQGLLLARFDVPGRRLALLLQVLPVTLPPFLLALGWYHLIGREGLLGSDQGSKLLFSSWGVIGTLALSFAPLPCLLTALGLWGMDASLEDAARVAGRPFQVAARILLPSAAPAIASSALIVFALSFSELGVPLFLLRAGVGEEVYPAAVFARLGGIDPRPGEAALLALPILPLALSLLFLERMVLRGRSFAVMGLRGRNLDPLPLKHGRPLAAVLTWIAVLVPLSPLVALFLRALSRGGLAGVSRWIGSSLFNSLVFSASAATIITLLGLVLGHALARRKRGVIFLDAVALLSFFTPASVLGVGLIALWNRPSLAMVYGSPVVVVLAFLARYAVIGLRSAASTFSQVPPSVEEVAAAYGAGYLRRVGRVILPLSLRGVAGTWIVAMLFCLRDLETAILIYPPGGDTLTVRIFTLEANGPPEVIAALAIVHAAVTVLLVAALAALVRRGGA